MQIFSSDRFELPLPAGHRFPMAKYRLLREAVERAGLVPAADLLEPLPASDEELLRVHEPGYLGRVVGGRLEASEVREIGFPWSARLVERSRRSVGATLGACRSALARGAGVNLAGGTHHAFADRGAGFCVFNDAAVAARTVQAEGLASRVLIFDCDVHQGDGTAAIFTGDPSVFTVSLHGERNYPARKQVSDLDLALPDGTGDRVYLEALERGLAAALEAGPFELAIYLAGADPFEKDRLGRLALSRRGLSRRDRRVFEICAAAGLPVAVVMAGGYAEEVETVVALHLRTVELALGVLPARGRSSTAKV